MAGQKRMAGEEVIRQVLLDEHADVLRESLKLLVRELMEVEVSELVGAELGERRHDAARRIATAIARGAGTRAPARSSCRSQSCARGATSRDFCSRASALSRRSCRSFSRPMSAASRRAASISSSSRSA